jgi:hypothetical protein
MEEHDWVRHCEKIEQLLRDVRQQLPNVLTAEEGKYFDESLEANELGIAYDLVCDKLDELNVPISQPLYNLLAIVGFEMGYDPAPSRRLKVL